MRSNERAAQTYRQSLIRDRDRERNPKAHDDLVNLLSKPANTERVIDHVFKKQLTKRRDEAIDKLYKAKEQGFSIEDPIPSLTLSVTPPIMSKPIGHRIGSKPDGSPHISHVAGFLDLYVDNLYANTHVSVSVNSKDARAIVNNTEPYLFGRRFVDWPPIEESPHPVSCKLVGERYCPIAFEVKIEIESVPELIQQINFYKTFIDSGTPIVVVSPDVRHIDLIKSQGVYFYEPYGSDEAKALIAERRKAA